MEVTLKEIAHISMEDIERGFNPCFNGSDSKRSIAAYTNRTGMSCFNPCFNGSDSKRIMKKSDLEKLFKFQSLF